MKTRLKVGKQTRLDDIQARYRRDMMKVYDLPWGEQAQRVREILVKLAADKAAIGAKDGGDDE